MTAGDALCRPFRGVVIVDDISVRDGCRLLYHRRLLPRQGPTSLESGDRKKRWIVYIISGINDSGDIWCFHATQLWLSEAYGAMYPLGCFPNQVQICTGILLDRKARVIKNLLY